MTMIKISSFQGEIPRMSQRLLPDSAAQSAINVKLTSGALKPFHVPVLQYAPAAPTTVNTIFIARNGVSVSSWFAWASANVDCVRVPLATEVESRFCWTGDGVPKIAKYTTAISGAGNDYPKVCLTLGIPAPQTAPTMTPTGGSGAAVTRVYCYTFFSQDGEESAPSPLPLSVTGKVDDTWALTTMDTAPTNSGTGTGSFTTPSTTFTNGSSAKHWLRVGDEIAFGGSATVFRTVTEITSASAFKVTGDFSAETTWARRANWNTSSMTRRIYRTSGTAGNFLLVAQNLNPATTSYNDTVLDIDLLGDELITEGWLPPPVGLKGLAVHSSGALVGFSGNIIYFSEPLQPHAWLAAYKLSAGYDGIGLATYGSTVVLATAGSPYIADGVDASSMSGFDAPGLLPCLSKQSVASVGNAVLYASKHGIVSVGADGVNLFTEQFFTRDEWVTLAPETMQLVVANGRVYVRAGNEILIFDGGLLSRAQIRTDSLYADEASGELYFARNGDVYLWDAIGAQLLVYTWRSKEFVLPEPVNFGVAKVDFDGVISAEERAAIEAARVVALATNAGLLSGGNVHGAVNAAAVNVFEANGSDFVPVPAVPDSNEVTLSLYGGDDLALLATRVISDTKMFRLPGGYKYDAFVVQLSSQTTIRDVRIAETPDELRTA